MYDSRLINANCYHNHEKIKINSSPATNKTSQKQKTQQMKNKSTLNASWGLMMINCPLLWHFPPFENLRALHPLG
jgi:hypothetical protein